MTGLPLISPLDRILFLKAQPYLAGEPPEVLTALASYTEERFHAAGALVRAGHRPVEEILFIAEGSLEVERPTANGADRAGSGPPRRIEAPGVVGIPHAGARALWAPAVRAAENTVLLALDIDDLDQIFLDHVGLLLNFVRRTAEEALRAKRSLGMAREDEPGFDGVERLDTPVELDLVHRLARARRAPFFRHTNLTLLGQLIRHEDVRRLEPGERLWSVGDPIDRMSLILDGAFQSEGPFGEVCAPAGAVVGSLEILIGSRREESWVAREVSRVLSIRRSLWLDLLEDHPELARDYHAYCCRAALDAWAREDLADESSLAPQPIDGPARSVHA